MEDPIIIGNTDATSATPASKPIVKRKVMGPMIPDDILQNAALNEAIKRLPSNYSFEVHKTLWRIRTCNAKKVALQLPEGLLMYACTLSDILERFGNVETLIMGDVTYGACCIDDYTAKALGCDLMVHYGHSCLVPIDVAQMNTLYVFVDIGFNIGHLITMLHTHFPRDARLILAGTIQFSAALQAAKRVLTATFTNILIPQCRPLSQGEVLGCTSPYLPSLYPKQSTNKPASTSTNPETSQSADASRGCCADKSACGQGAPEESSEQSGCCGGNSESVESTEPVIIDIGAKSSENKDICVFIADGRFHLESLMIHNPQIDEFYKYDPYNRMLTAEAYDTETLHSTRWAAIEKGKHARKWGVVLGTLGRQGNTVLMDRIESELKKRGKEYVVVLLSEVFPAKLALMADVDAWVQIACPRLSIDWGYAFAAPLLSTYEFDVCMGLAEWLPNGVYPMDFYSNHGGAWSNYHHRVHASAAGGDAVEEMSPDGGVLVKKSGKMSAIARIRARAAAKRAEKEQGGAVASSRVGEVSGGSGDALRPDVEDMD